MSSLDDEHADTAEPVSRVRTQRLVASTPRSGARETNRATAIRAGLEGYWSGSWSKEFMVRFWFPLAAAVFISGGVASAYLFDGAFDWRYRTLSSLSSEVTNPNGYAYCCIGLILSFAIAIPLCGYFQARIEPFAPKLAYLSCLWLRVGFIGSIGVGLERYFSQTLAVQIGKTHEYISLITFLGFALGLTGFSVGLIIWLVRERRWPFWALAGCFVASSAPILGTGLSQGYLYFVPNELGWVGPHWAEMGVPVYLSLSFWEWLLSAAIFSYLFIILLCLPAAAPSRL